MLVLLAALIATVPDAPAAHGRVGTTAFMITMTEPRAELARLARAAGIDTLTWIPAVNGSDPQSAPCLADLNLDLGFIQCDAQRRVVRKRLGQACSAVRSMEYVLSSAASARGDDSVHLVLEDDARYMPSPQRFATHWSTLRTHLRSGALGEWDVINLGPCYEAFSRLKECTQISASPTSLWLTRSIRPWCTQALVVSAAGAAKLKALFAPFPRRYYDRARRMLRNVTSCNLTRAQEVALGYGYDTLIPNAIRTRKLVAYSTWPLLVEQRDQLNNSRFNYAHELPPACRGAAERRRGTSTRTEVGRKDGTVRPKFS